MRARAAPGGSDLAAYRVLAGGRRRALFHRSPLPKDFADVNLIRIGQAIALHQLIDDGRQILPQPVAAVAGSLTAAESA